MQYPGQVSGSSNNTLTRYQKYPGGVIKIPGLGFAQAQDKYADRHSAGISCVTADGELVFCRHAQPQPPGPGRQAPAAGKMLT